MTRRQRVRKIKAECALHGVSMSAVARKLDVSPQHVSAVVNLKTTSARVLAELVKAGVPAALFQEPEEDGNNGREAV